MPTLAELARRAGTVTGMKDFRPESEVPMFKTLIYTYLSKNFHFNIKNFNHKARYPTNFFSSIFPMQHDNKNPGCINSIFIISLL